MGGNIGSRLAPGEPQNTDGVVYYHERRILLNAGVDAHEVIEVVRVRVHQPRPEPDALLQRGVEQRQRGQALGQFDPQAGAAPRHAEPRAGRQVIGDGRRHLLALLGEPGAQGAQVVIDLAAGEVSAVGIGAGACARIMTGAPLPPGADSVVPIEAAVEGTAGAHAGGRVRLREERFRAGQHVARQGAAFRRGQEVLAAGMTLGAAEIGLAAEAGATHVVADPRVRVAILSTGSELVPPSAVPAFGQTRNSNGPMLAAAVHLLDAEPVALGIAADRPEAIRAAVGFNSSNTRFYSRDIGESLYRRSLYTFLKRTAPPPFMSNFDAPNREQFCARRDRSNTPLQALQLMNDVQHVEAARGLATRLLVEASGDDASRIAWLYRTVLARHPQPAEAAVVADTLAGHRKRYAADGEAARKLVAHGESKPPESLPAGELAAWTLVANMMLNLDETLTRN